MSKNMNKAEPFCFNCAKPFVDSGYVRYCSKECKQVKLREYKRNHTLKNPRVYKPKPPKIKQCLFCFSDFTAVKRNLYCSDVCKQMHDCMLNPSKYVKLCTTCNKSIKERKTGKVYCSKECRPVTKIDKDKAREWRRKQRKLGKLPGGRDRSRAKFYGVQYDYVKPITIFKRDGWQCWKCKRFLDPSLRGKNKPKSPEIDHVFPISLGGPHIASNLACICRACNIKKSNKI